ncbi:HDOD domain-containing protein [Pseudomonas sp. SP16.1]|uniref:HDOD domain-containing protein n=1 Tax=Pseudomonas sp. SP16.1 TaxID=3458854 RepID=UPI0040462C80
MRVLILEDDPWIADLLKQIVLSLRPAARVDCRVRVAEAIAAWQQETAQLVIADWNLPDGSGTRLLEAVRSDDREVPLVMVTARADRDSVLEVRPLRVSAFISKPFQVPKVLDCLQRLLPGDEPGACSDHEHGDFAEILAALADEDLDLPLRGDLLEQLRQTAPAPSTLQQLGELWPLDPAVQARLIAAANSPGYNSAGQPCVSLAGALQRLGQATALNLIQGLALRPVAALQDDALAQRGQALLQASLALHRRVTELAGACRIDPAPLQSAALLHRLGEWALLYQAQRGCAQGRTLDDDELQRALQAHSGPLANRLKAHWRLPVPLRELIGACYALVPGNTRREPILMRLACAELQGAEQTELERLRRLAGLA